MRTFIQELPASRQRTSARAATPAQAPSSAEIEEGSTVPGPTRVPFDFSRIPLHSTARPRIQPKLAVSAPGDLYEQEAERVSGQVMSMPEPMSHERLRRESAKPGGLEQAAVPPLVHEVLRSPGQPLDPATRAFMEPRFGYDFGHVRVHTDARADAASASVGARAFTVGGDIVFRQGELAPHTQSSRALLAHELAHTIQQSASPGISSHDGGGPAGRLSAAPTGIARQPAAGARDSGPSLREQADTLKGMFSRLVAESDRNGWDGVVFVITHRGTWLEPTMMEKLGPQKQRPSGTVPLSEAEAAKKVEVYLGVVLDFGPGAWRFEFKRDRRGIMHSQGWTQLEGAPKPQAAPAPAVKTDECDESDSNYGQCLADQRERQYKEGIQAAGVVAEAFLDPTAGPPGGPGTLVKLPPRLERLRKIREAARGRTRRHTGYNVAYTVTGPHNKLKGTSVYVLKDADGTVLYVGKGEALNRLREHIKDPRKTQWFGEIEKVDVRATGLNNTQALALEEDLIGQLKPLYNVDLNPFQKEFRGTLELAPNLPRAQRTLKFHLEWGH